MLGIHHSIKGLHPLNFTLELNENHFKTEN